MRLPWVRAVEAVGRGTAWYSISNKASAPREADVYVYDVIGEYGVTAAAFAQEIAALDVDAINLKLNSPGGDVFDGVAIHNALKSHPARVNVTVDALAASAASFIAMAGDTIHMARGAELMIHEAHALEAGDATAFTAMAARLERIGDKIAGFYAERAGGDVAQWRAAMRKESWYSGQEAVDARLADSHDDPPKVKLIPVGNTFDLTGFTYAGRDAAPPPVVPMACAPAAEPDPFESFISALGGGHS